MALAVTLVTAFSSLMVSLIRRHIPGSIRIIVQMTIIATLVIIGTSCSRPTPFRSAAFGLCGADHHQLHRSLRPAEACHEKPAGLGFLDGIGNGLGYSLVLFIVAFFRELLGTGTLFGHTILPLVANNGWYQPNGPMLLPPSAFS